MLGLFKGRKALFALTMAMGVVGSALTVVAAFILEDILNAVVSGDRAEFNRQLWIVLWYVVALVVAVTCGALVEKRLIAYTLRDFRAAIHRGILSRDSERYRQANTADYLSSLTNDTKIVEENVIVPFLNAIQYAIVFVFAAVALFIYSPIIGGVLLASLLLMYLLPSSLGQPIGRRQVAYSAGLSLFTLKLKDQFLGYDVIRSFRLRDRVEQDFAQQNDDLARRKFGVDKLLAVSEGIAQVIAAASQIGTMLVAGLLVLDGRMAPGALLAILQLAGAFVAPVGVIMQAIPMIQGAKPVLDRLREFSTPAPSAFTGNIAPAFERDIRLENVGFGYTEGNPVLVDADVRIERGKKYVIAGGSGCGKSTMIRLLSAEYSTYTGAIRVDGTELRDLDIDLLLTKISTIHQGVYMFDESVGENIALHRSYPDEEWARALRISGVDKFLPLVEGGLDAPVGEAGANLSGGQRQRVAVARALIERKPILIIDEGTSAVDVQTAFDIENALLDIDDLTMLTITHNLRPELLRRYDAILYMDQGRVAEAGTYDELMARAGRFADFQSVRADDDAQTAGIARKS